MAPVRAGNGRFAKKGAVERRLKTSEHMTQLNVLKKEKKLEEERELVHSVGSRIVDVAVLANKLWCKLCKQSLSLRNLEKEVHRGLASVFYVRCVTCLDLVRVPTSKPIRVRNSSYPLWSVNMKAAAGCVDSGTGHEQFNTLVSSMNIPAVNHHTMKRAEEKVGVALEKQANESVKRALLEEKRLTEEANRCEPLSPPPEENPEDPDEPSTPQASREIDYVNNPTANPSTGLISEYDWGWDKRGSGHDYNSKSGRGAAIGYRTKKIIAVGVKCVSCAMCNAGHPPEDHDCRKNHTGSAKAMEPQGAVDLMVTNKDWKEAGVHLDVLIGDEDASTFARVQQQTTHEVKKWVDLNHCRKGFTKRLYKMKSNFTFLSPKVIKYLQKCLSYAIRQNKNKPAELAAAIRNVVDHVHGEHDMCGDWCNAKGKETYFFKNLPRGRCWTGDSRDPWRKALTKLVEEFAKKADRIAPGGSTQNCESFNQMCITRAPKSRYYGSTPALSYRVSAAVLQKNEGANHLSGAYTDCNISPGINTAKYRAQVEKLRERKAARQRSLEFKRRRLQLHLARSGDDDCCEYASGMASTMERAVAAATTAASEISAWIPDELPLAEDCAVVIVDTETTGLGGDAEIVQLSARCGDKIFDAYMIPAKKINPHAEETTGLSVRAGDLYYHTNKLHTKPPADVASQFLQFLSKQGSQVLLVGHNAVRFDIPLILKFMNAHGLARAMCSVIYGLTDTIPLLKQKGESNKQADLAKKYLTGPEWDGVHQGAHNAAVDCQLLQGLLRHFELDNAKLISSSIKMKAYMENQALAKKAKSNLPQLAPLKTYVSAGMLTKMAKHGITIDELKNEWSLHQRQGIEVCLGVRVDGKPRVTKSKPIVDKVCEFIEKLCEISDE